MPKRPVVWNGVAYPSVKIAAKSINVSYAAMQHRLRKGMTCDADLNLSSRSKPITWNGIEYPSIDQAAAANGITGRAMKQRLEYGYSGDADMPGRHPKK